MQLPSQHCGGVNALASLPSESNLFTASKDSTVKRYCVCNPWTGNLYHSYMMQGCSGRWGLQEKQPVLEASFEGHNDWVNDIIVLEDVLVSCSSDTIIKLWKADESGKDLNACMACDKHLLANAHSLQPQNFTTLAHTLCRLGSILLSSSRSLHMQADCPNHLANALITCLITLMTNSPAIAQGCKPVHPEACMTSVNMFCRQLSGYYMR